MLIAVLSCVVGISVLLSILWLWLRPAMNSITALVFGNIHAVRFFGWSDFGDLAENVVIVALSWIWYLFVVVYVGTALVSLTSVIIQGNISLQSLAHALLLDQLWALLLQYPLYVIPAIVVGTLLVGGGYLASNALSKRNVQKHVRAALAKETSKNTPKNVA
jgi:hypothetical protein